jgi:hypothetical protein
MVDLTEDRAVAEPTNKHVLTEHEAFALLSNSHGYFTSFEPISGRHRTEIVAEAMARDGLTGTAEDTMFLHSQLKLFHQGDYSAIGAFNQVPLIENLLVSAKGTKFERAVEDIIRPLESFIEIFDRLSEARRQIDEDRSSEVLAKVKQDRFPEDMSMVEKLDKWQRDQTPGRH